MDFRLNSEHQAVVDLARQVTREVIAPRADEVDRTGEYPEDYFQAFRETGLLGVAIPEEYGGAGLGCLGLVLAVEEVAKACCSAGLILLLTRLSTMAILLAGTEEQKKKYLGGTATGELRGAFCLSEPDAGSDTQAIRTRAVRKGDRYVITGTKSWISGAGVADFFVVAAKTDWEVPGARGYSVFVVDRDTPGLTVGKKEQKMGVRGVPVHQVIFEEVEVPVSARIGEENGGFKIIMQNLNAVRPVVAARGVGLAEGALMYWLQYARQRQTFGKPIVEHQGLQWMAADLATEIEAARLLTYRAALLVDEGKTGKEVAHYLSMAKYKATEVAVKAANDCLQMMGAVGYMEDYPMARFVRDARQLTIVEGTSQIQKNIIGRALADGLLTWL
ncbi:MAG: acyl-CoA dehydrogenase family protein [Firmicutes bacterium]|nr:acyl-CoA dehydrogenase family protein [Bacillota bacterium]